MSQFSRNITPFVEAEIERYYQAQEQGDYSVAFHHLENAHVLGQESTFLHIKVHFLMLLWGVNQHDSKEVRGQILRVIASFVTCLLRCIGRVPIGNTGGSNVSPTKAMPIKPEFEKIINRAKGMTDINATAEALPRNIFIPLLVVGVLLAACYGSTFMLVDHLKLLGLDPTLAGSAISSGVVVTLVSAVFAGRLAKRVGLFRSVSIAAVLMALAMLGFSTAEFIPGSIFAGGIFLGAAWAIFYILAPLIIIDAVSSAVRIKYLTFLSGAQMLGLGLSAPVGGFLADLGFAFSGIYAGLGVISLFCATLFLLMSKGSSKTSTASHSLTLSSVATILANRTIFPAVMIGLLACVFSGLATFQSLYAETRGLNPSTFFVMFTIVAVILRFGVAAQIAKLPIYGFSITLVLIIIISLVLFFMNKGSTAFYILASVTFAVGYGLSYSTLNTIAVNTAETKGLPISSSSQVFTLFYFVGIFGFPFIAGQIISVASVNMMLLTMLCISVCVVFLGAYLRAKNA